MFLKRKKVKLVTHNDRFHADDVFATATLLIMLDKEIKDVEIIRTRDKEIIESGDFVYDIGGLYDGERRFDHHQESFNEKRKNGIPYSSFGLVWKKFGVQVCSSERVAEELDKKIVQPIDAMDNGVDIYQYIYKGVHPYMFNDIVCAFIPTWPEKRNFSENFLKIVNITKEILEREITKESNKNKARDILADIYNKTEDKRIIVLDESYPWDNILNKYSEPLFVIRTRSGSSWTVKAVRDDIYSFQNRKDFPKEWAGKIGEELAKITGVEDSLFCHNKRFICSAKSKEGAIKLAKLALSNTEE